MPKIFITAEETGPEWWYGIAVAEDGTVLAGHISSSKGFAIHDMGINSEWKHNKYKEHYPDGYELEWIDIENIDSHEGWKTALERNKQQAESSSGDGAIGNETPLD